ncbi:MAG: DUF883 family protein [Rubrivivax sp.]|jgi:ElaB/YqjD/DUF883 family membrane-anchored ribosome-binding protein
MDSRSTAASREQLMADLKLVVADAEALLKLSADDASDHARDLRARLGERLSDVRLRLADWQVHATEKVKAAGHAADDYVHEHPWQSVAAGAGVGLLVGLLIGRR